MFVYIKWNQTFTSVALLVVIIKLHMIMIPADHPTPISFENIRDDNDNDNVYFIKLY